MNGKLCCDKQAMEIAIIGASSFIGGSLTAQLVREGHNVIPVYRREPEGGGAWWADIQGKIQGDIRDDNVLKDTVACTPDVCVYLVSLNHVDSAGPISQVISVNLLPMWRLLEEFSEKDWRGQFIYMSTQQVYGLMGEDTIDELHPASPRNHYALTHYMVKTCVDITTEITVSILFLYDYRTAMAYLHLSPSIAGGQSSTTW